MVLFYQYVRQLVFRSLVVFGLPCLTWAQPDSSGAKVVAEFQVAIPPAQLEGLPDAFSKPPYALYWIYDDGAESVLQWAIGVPVSAASNWTTVADNQGWKTVANQGRQFFFAADSSFANQDSLFASLQVPGTGTSLRGNQMHLGSGWRPALQGMLQDREDSSAFLKDLPWIPEAQIAELIPWAEWWLAELAQVTSMSWTFDAGAGEGMSSIALQTQAGTRLSRSLSQDPAPEMRILDFVELDQEKLRFGNFNAARLTSYFNYWYRGTALLEQTAYADIRTALDPLDSGFFDLWDGSWALWQRDESGGSMLLLGGRYLSGDLDQLFTVLANLDLQPFGKHFVLDDNNTIVGFSRIRSLEWYSSESGALLAQWYFSVSNGCLLIADNEQQIVEKVFQLNSRRPVTNSARSLHDQSSGMSAMHFEDGNLVASIEFNEGGLNYRKNGASTSLDQVLQAAIKKLLN